MNIHTHTNEATGESYYSKTDETGAVIFSLTIDFDDVWTESEMTLFQKESANFQFDADRAWASGEHE